MDRFQFAALDTLQHGLTRNAEFQRGLQHGQVFRRSFLDETRPQYRGHANLPRRSGSQLFTSDKAVVETTMQRRWGEAEGSGGLADVDQFSHGLFGGRLIAGDLSIAPQSSHMNRREMLPGCAPP